MRSVVIGRVRDRIYALKLWLQAWSIGIYVQLVVATRLGCVYVWMMIWSVVFVCVCVCVCMCVYVCVCMYACVCVGMCVCWCVCWCVCVCMYVCLCVCVCGFVCMYVCVYICSYVYVCLADWASNWQISVYKAVTSCCIMYCLTQSNLLLGREPHTQTHTNKFRHILTQIHTYAHTIRQLIIHELAGIYIYALSNEFGMMIPQYFQRQLTTSNFVIYDISVFLLCSISWEASGIPRNFVADIVTPIQKCWLHVTLQTHR